MNMFLPSKWIWVALFLVAWITIHFIRVYRRLRHIPGPVSSRISNLSRVYWVQRGESHTIHQALHDRYGPYVRLGPNMVSVSDPDMISTLYPMRAGLPKGDFYRTLMPYTRSGAALPLVFNTRDEELHKHLKSPIAPIFSLSSILRFEPFVEEVIQILFDELDRRFVDSADACDLGDWLQYFAFEVMATMTFSKRYGFLESGADDNGLIAAIWNFMKAAAPMTQIPWFDRIWYKNSVAAALRPTTGMPILKLALDSITERRAKTQGAPNPEKGGVPRGDMLNHFLTAQMADPAVPEWAPTAWTFSNLIAGSDSTAVVMRTLWFNLLKHRSSYRSLLGELEQASLSRPFPAFAEVRHLPYLEACINEAIRLHPPFCLPFERVVPEGGIALGGVFLPGGTVVGMNPWVVNRATGTFGENADSWCPERWTKCNAEDRKAMEQSIMTFGAGRRVCLGKNIAILELKKLTSALILNYDLELVDEGSFRTENYWFFRQLGLKAVCRRRRD